jgi:prepilin-type N-terminal cleavage/methylation domain-containing protein
MNVIAEIGVRKDGLRAACRKRRPADRASGGFTLVELVAVVMIIGVVLLIVVPRLDFLIPKYTLRAGARQLANSVKLGKSQAIAQGRNSYMVYDIPGNKYWMLVPELEKDERQENASPLDDQKYRWEKMFPGELPEGVWFEDVVIGQSHVVTGGTVYIEFSPMGIGRAHIIHLAGEGGDKISLEVNPLTGLVAFYDFYKEPRPIEAEESE